MTFDKAKLIIYIRCMTSIDLLYILSTYLVPVVVNTSVPALSLRYLLKPLSQEKHIHNAFVKRDLTHGFKFFVIPKSLKCPLHIAS